MHSIDKTNLRSKVLQIISVLEKCNPEARFNVEEILGFVPPEAINLYYNKIVLEN